MKLDHDRAVRAYVAAFGPDWPSRGEMTVEQEKDWILSPFWVLLGQDEDDEDHDWAGVFEFMSHCGIDLESIQTDPKAADLSAEDVILSHYRLPSSRFDLDRLVDDFASQPRIVARVQEMQDELAARREARRKQQRESHRRRRAAKRLGTA